VPLADKLKPLFNPPRALEHDEIEALVQRYARSAAVVQLAGFSGVQIHGAHGYLVNQFLSPHHNRRQDSWGGTATKRMRFLLEVISAIRGQVGDAFPIGLKLNSADFQRGGFSEEESMAVVQAVQEAGVDLVEISGGSYEAPAMTGIRAKESTLKREAYFLDYAQKVRKLVQLPLVVTGGFRSAAGMAAAIDSGAIDMVGLARPLAIEPDLPNRILGGEDFISLVRPIRTGLAAIDSRGILELSWYNRQLARMCAGKDPLPEMGAWRSLVGTVFSTGWRGLSRKRA
jgi:2,4-dienoyl-CoA reductase-like NADH-dependent reductase (Old Yellow Enzyme family)